MNKEWFYQVFEEMICADGQISNIQHLVLLLEEISSLRTENAILKERLNE